MKATVQQMIDYYREIGKYNKFKTWVPVEPQDKKTPPDGWDSMQKWKQCRECLFLRREKDIDESETSYDMRHRWYHYYCIHTNSSKIYIVTDPPLPEIYHYAEEWNRDGYCQSFRPYTDKIALPIDWISHPKRGDPGYDEWNKNLDAFSEYDNDPANIPRSYDTAIFIDCFLKPVSIGFGILLLLGALIRAAS